METTIGGEAHHFYGLGSANFRAKGKRSPEWDPNDWKWDGDLFVASHLNPNPSDFQSRQFFPLESGVPTAGASSNSSSTSSDELDLGIEKAKRDLEKRRRVIVVEDDNLEDEAGSLSLKLGGHTTERVVVENWDGANGKKARVVGTTLHRAVCQVENCRSDLSKAKDYHRRHKVCEMHSKAGKALVGNVMQRFCQQCSRFHALQEFDEGKRSCRRRLAGHNKRRRKTQPDAPVNSESSNDNQASGYLLITLLRILSNMHSNANQTDPDLLSHLVRSLSSCGGIQGGENINGLLLESHNLLKNNISAANSEMVSALQSNGLQVPPRPKQQHRRLIGSVIPQERLPVEDTSFQDIQTASSQRPRFLFPIQDSPTYPETRDSSAGKSKLNNFDLNDIYIDSDDAIEVDRYPVHVDLGTGSLECPSWVQQNSHQSSPPQTSGNSDSASAQSPSISTGDAQSRTDRIVFKLFGKDPSDFPFVLRAQILDWLSHSPTDIESYIRPGCIILTIYLRMPESVWEELCCDLSSSLSRLLEISDDDTFWRTGWVYVRVQNQIAFIYNGQVVVDTSLPFKSKHYSTILSVSPIAVSVSEKTQFLVKGFNFSRPSMRLMCALEGNYLIPGANHGLVEDVEEQNDLQYMNFSCSIPAVAGRGFIEVEDHGLSSSFFPFIVAEKEVCSEICMLESEMELTQSGDILGGNGQSEARNLAMDFIHEMGWLLRSSQLKSRFGHLNTNSGLFPFNRFKWLMEFSMDHDWSAVVKKLLNILFDGTVGLGEHQFLKLALNEMGLLHRAVRRNSRPLVELLLSYVPEKVVDGLTVAGGESESVSGSEGSFFFRPDIVGPAGLTPLHVAAGRDGSEDVIDALTNDPGKVGVEAWRNCHDSTGFTPEDYARLRGHYSYIHLIQKKIVSRKLVHVVLEIPPAAALPCSNSKQKLNDASFGVERVGPCKRCCDHRHKYGSAISSRYRVARPAMLSMVAIAAVCVCVALLFKSSPQVFCVFRPFRWEMLDFGSI